MDEMKTLTIRLPISVYEKAADLAKSRHQSLNKLVQDGLRSIELQDREKRLFDDFTTIADLGREETEVDYAFDAQAEVAAVRARFHEQPPGGKLGEMRAGAHHFEGAAPSEMGAGVTG